jgi:hypothetical protein
VSNKFIFVKCWALAAGGGMSEGQIISALPEMRYFFCKVQFRLFLSIFYEENSNP